MYTNPRYDIILEYLKEHKRASVSQLCALVYASAATVRRDLADMQKLGLIGRTHGGAVYIEATEEIAISVRREVNAQDKDATAAIALADLPDFEVLFVDNSSTCLSLVRRMDLRGKVVVTNGFQVGHALASKEQVRILMPGGEFRKNSDLSGSLACSSLRTFRFDLMLSSCAAIDLKGAFETSLSVMELKATAIELSAHRILLADQTKFQAKAAYRVAPLHAYDQIFTNAPDDVLAPFRGAGIPIRNR